MIRAAATKCRGGPFRFPFVAMAARRHWAAVAHRFGAAQRFVASVAWRVERPQLRRCFVG